ncbi:MAG: hypothetical protein FJ015_06470, partial [Chloroflexi bacterium]|nr:hypothetical protein [Chloroflexota bacterium]
MTARKLGIVADDLTGAMDSSGYFASLGFSTVVVLDPDFSDGAAVLVITTNSRAEAPEVARERVRQAMRGMAGRVVYKKIDSTLRGNIGEELLVAVEAMASEKAVVAPAFPAVGRTTAGGILLVNGVPVAETQFARDPISPVKESSIPRLLERSMRRPVGCVSIEEIEAGPEALKQAINNRPEGVVVCDVVAPSHLSTIARAAALAQGRWLLCGSGGLAREMHLILDEALKVNKSPSKNKKVGSALVVVGTRNQVAASQLLKAHDELGIPVLDLETEKLDARHISSGRLNNVLKEAGELADKGKGLAISSAFSQYIPALKQAMPRIMAEMVAGILTSHGFAGLFLSGGDIALEVCRRLQASAIQVNGEVEPGVPAGELIG